ncbi:MAG: DUF4190 domain-containing protein [Kofleriaceae bacterium]
MRTLKANLKIEGQPCGWCQIALKLGDDTAICTACEQVHHRPCWDGRAGCATAGCAGAPLHRLDAPAAPAMGSPFPQAAPAAFSQTALPPPGYTTCPNPLCRLAVVMGAQLCPACKAITSPDGIYHGPKINAPGAVASLVYAILGFFICGVIFGAVAISKASQAKRSIASDPTLTGGGLATAGTVLGIIDLIAWAILLVARMS